MFSIVTNFVIMNWIIQYVLHCICIHHFLCSSEISKNFLFYSMIKLILHDLTSDSICAFCFLLNTKDCKYMYYKKWSWKEYQENHSIYSYITFLFCINWLHVHEHTIQLFNVWRGIVGKYVWYRYPTWSDSFLTSSTMDETGRVLSLPRVKGTIH